MQKLKDIIYRIKNQLSAKKTFLAFRTSGYKPGKQTTFVCGYCGSPMKLPQRNVYLKPTEKPTDLGSTFFSIKKMDLEIKGLELKQKIEHHKEIKDGDNLITCSSCKSSRFQNILMLKIMQINIGIFI